MSFLTELKPTAYDAGIVVSALSLLLVACGGGQKFYTKRIVETPAGRSHSEGAKKETTYSARVAMENNQAHITVFETSQCNLIEFDIVNRVEETLDGDQVIEKKVLTPRQQVTGVPRTIPCDERFARVPVELTFGDNTYPLGNTSSIGELHVDLAATVSAGVHGIAFKSSAPAGVLLVGGVPVGSVSLAGLASHEERVVELVPKLAALLAKPHAEIGDANLSEIYTLHSQLMALAPMDPRVIGLNKRFIEAMSGRKSDADFADRKRNLTALNEARGLIKDMAGLAPTYIVTDLQRNRPSDVSVGWARSTMLHAVRQAPELCGTKDFTVSIGGMTAKIRMASSYLQYTYNDGYSQWLGTVCGR